MTGGRAKRGRTAGAPALGDARSRALARDARTKRRCDRAIVREPTMSGGPAGLARRLLFRPRGVRFVIARLRGERWWDGQWRPRTRDSSDYPFETRILIMIRNIAR